MIVAQHSCSQADLSLPHVHQAVSHPSLQIFLLSCTFEATVKDDLRLASQVRLASSTHRSVGYRCGVWSPSTRSSFQFSQCGRLHVPSLLAVLLTPSCVRDGSPKSIPSQVLRWRSSSPPSQLYSGCRLPSRLPRVQ